MEKVCLRFVFLSFFVVFFFFFALRGLIKRSEDDAGLNNTRLLIPTANPVQTLIMSTGLKGGSGGEHLFQIYSVYAVVLRL